MQRDWRRKCGYITLALALVFCGAWIRSLLLCDRVFSYNSGTRHYVVLSFDGCLLLWSWNCISTEDNDWVFDVPEMKRSITSMRRRLEGARFFFQEEDLEEVAIPYIAFVLPLVLLSALLMLYRRSACCKTTLTQKQCGT